MAQDYISCTLLGIFTSLFWIGALISLISKTPSGAIAMGILAVLGTLFYIATSKGISKYKKFSAGEMYLLKAKVNLKGTYKTNLFELKYDIDNNEETALVVAGKLSELSEYLRKNEEVKVYVPVNNTKICFIRSFCNISDIIV